MYLFTCSADAPEGKRTACYDIEVEIVSLDRSVLDVTHLYDYISLQDDPLKSSMHSFLMSSTHQQEIANLDAKASCQL